MLEFIPRSPDWAAEWDDLVGSSPDGWVFSLYGWQELILQVADWELRDHSFGVRENGRLVIVVPLQLNPKSNLLASSGWGGSGPVLVSGLRPKDRERLLRLVFDRCLAIAQEERAHCMALSCSPVTQASLHRSWGVNEFVFYNFVDRSGLSQVIDLRVDEEELWRQLSADARRQIRKAEENGVRVERAIWAEHIDSYYALHSETYLRTGVQPHPKAYFAGMAAYTAPNNHSVLWKAVAHDGTSIAYHNAAWFGIGGYYHTGCSSRSAGETGANYLLFWKALLGAKTAGIKWYDCGAIFPNATDSKQRGLTTFKTKFGGAPHRIFRAECSLQSDSPSIAAVSDTVATTPFTELASELARRAYRRLFARNER